MRTSPIDCIRSHRNNRIRRSFSSWAMRSPASFPLIWLSLGLAPLLRKPSTVIAECVLDLGVEDRYWAEVGHFWHEQVPCAKGAVRHARARRCKDELMRCPSTLKKVSALSISPLGGSPRLR